MSVYGEVLSEIRKSLDFKEKEFLASVRVVVFGPGSGDEIVYRHAVRDMLRSKGCESIYPEDVLQNSGLNAAIAERELVDKTQMTFVVFIGMGPTLELALYLSDKNIAWKFRIFQQSKYVHRSSFVNEVLQPFANYYKQLYVFGNQAELVSIAAQCLEDCVKYHALIGWYRQGV